MTDEDLKPYLDQIPVLIVRAEDIDNPVMRARIDHQKFLLLNAIMTARMNEVVATMIHFLDAPGNRGRSEDNGDVPF